MSTWESYSLNCDNLMFKLTVFEKLVQFTLVIYFLYESAGFCLMVNDFALFWTMVKSFEFDRSSNSFELSFKLSFNCNTSSSVRWSLHYFFVFVTNPFYQKFACFILLNLILYSVLFWTFHCFNTHRFLNFSDFSFDFVSSYWFTF